jgi:type I restriction enzyme S subunit
MKQAALAWLEALRYQIISWSDVKLGLTGSHQRDKPSGIAELTVRVPPSDASTASSHLVASLYNRLMLNQRQNRRLTGLHDTLLPKLMRGEIKIPAAETVAKEVSKWQRSHA